MLPIFRANIYEFIFENLYKQAVNVLPKEHKILGDLVSIDGSLIDAVLSMYWADYRKGSQKAKAHYKASKGPLKN